MDLTLLRETVTVISFIAFIGVVVYALAPANRKRYERAAWMAVEDEHALAGLAVAGDDAPCRPGEQAQATGDGRDFANEGHR